MKSFRFALLLALAAAAFAAPASAWPYIDVTASEVLSVDPPRVRTTFEITSVGYEPGASYQFFSIYPFGSEPLAHLHDCGAPPGWTCGGDFPLELGGLFFNGSNASDWAPVLTFAIVTDLSAPCVRFVFYDPVLAKSPSPTMHYDVQIDACLLLDAPVPTQTKTWGSVKSRYR